MAPPPPSGASRLAGLILRFLVLVFVVAAAIVLTTNTATLETQSVLVTIHFKDIYSYRYMLATIVMAGAYTLLQIAMTIIQISSGNITDGNLQFNFYGDKIVSYILATGAAAGFGATKDMKSALSGSGSEVDNFFNKGYGAASVLLLGFFCAAALSTKSSYALPKQA